MAAQGNISRVSPLSMLSGAVGLPDVSFFAGDGSLNSATLICVSALGACVSSGQLAAPSTEPSAQEVGGTSVATPQMAGVMALINQKAGSAQGLANPELYSLAARQTYSPVQLRERNELQQLLLQRH